MGYVGLTLAAFLAKLNMNVHGVEIRKAVLLSLKVSKASFYEPNLDETLSMVIRNKQFTFSDKIPQSDKSRYFIITVGTPLAEDSNPNLNFIESAAKEVANVLNDGDFVILRSTVKLGVTNQIVRKILNESGKKYGLAFCPERTLEGSALNELGELPQIIGADNNEDREKAAKFFSQVTSLVVKVSNIETAEMIKLVDNMQRDTSFAISNEVARMCNQINVKASEVILSGKNKYPRTNLAMPGPVGGPCLEKDTYILNSSFNLPHSLSLTARIVNESIIDESLNLFSVYFKDRIAKNQINFKLAIIGLAFKGVPETNDLRGSMALRMIKAIRSKFENINICGFDPVVFDGEINNLGIKVTNNYQEAFEKSDLVLLMNNHPMITRINFNSMADKMKSGGMIYDYWSRLDQIGKLPNQIIAASWGSHAAVFKESINE